MSHAFTNRQLRATCSSAEQLLPINTPGGLEERGRAQFSTPRTANGLGEGQMA